MSPTQPPSASTPPDPTIAQAKREARAQGRAARRTRGSWAPDDPRRTAEAHAIARAVLAGGGSLVGEGTIVASYVAWPSEPPTAALHDALTARGARVIVPLVLPDMDLDWAPLEGGDPLGVAAIGAASLLVIPALRVDGWGTRLGQGGGCYDRALARRSPGAPVVALIDDDGLVERVPAEAHDARVDAVVGPTMAWTALPLPADRLRKSL